MQFHPPTRLLTELFWAAREGWRDDQRGGGLAGVAGLVNRCQPASVGVAAKRSAQLLKACDV